MMKTQIGLGVFAIPSALDVLGMVQGVLCMIAIAVITTWSGYMIGAFKLNHREVYSIDDAGGIMFDLPGRAYLLYSVGTVNRQICHIDRRIWLFQTSPTPSWRQYSCLWQLPVPCCQPKRFDSTRSIDA
jgi:hypothetical protein